MINLEFIDDYLQEFIEVINRIEREKINTLVNVIAECRTNKGRIFFIGVGGSAANCSHAVNDFRKIAGIESYAVTDNIAELTARTNDDGWNSVFASWLQISQLNSKDIVFILSVGGGDLEKNVSVNLIEATKLAKSVKAKILGIVGDENGYTAKNGDCVVVVPVVNPNNVTPHAESMQAVVWHLIVSHPRIKIFQTKWESIEK